MGHVYAISDLHGCWYNFEETLKILQPDDIVYCLGHKVNIDCGTVFTGISTMIDLDTWEEHIIVDKKERVS